MVFCDGAVIASTVASLVMNGVCCVWQMQEEEERRDNLRKDIRVEYERQLLMEQEIWEQRQNEYDRKYHSDSSLQEEDRRRRLLLCKKIATRMKDKERRDGTTKRAVVSPSTTDSTAMSEYSLPTNFPTRCDRRRIGPMNPTMKVPPVWEWHMKRAKMAEDSSHSSLLDSDMDTDDDTDTESLIDIALQ